MGYSTTKIDLTRALELVRARHMKCTEWSVDLSPNKIPGLLILRKAYSASISDHVPPRLYFDFKDNNFATFEEQALTRGKREVVTLIHAIEDLII